MSLSKEWRFLVLPGALIWMPWWAVVFMPVALIGLIAAMIEALYDYD